ncbi:MAG TPA: hypothetical protein VKP69_17135 [Isosphaeraceae bacterium]|nr:hypothetical protein [Isosphaeraceae bacterium]
MNPNVLNTLRQRKRRILRRIKNRPGPERQRPMVAADNTHEQFQRSRRGP